MAGAATEVGRGPEAQQGPLWPLRKKTNKTGDQGDSSFKLLAHQWWRGGGRTSDPDLRQEKATEPGRTNLLGPQMQRFLNLQAAKCITIPFVGLRDCLGGVFGGLKPGMKMDGFC